MTGSEPAPSWNYGKSTEGMRRLATSLEPTDMALGVDQTPVDRFFVCSASDAPRIESDNWRLTITGDACTTSRTIDWSELAALPQRTVAAWLECAGNGRAMYELEGGFDPPSAVEDTAWTLGAMGMATWHGVSLRDVLALAGVAEDAQWIGIQGGDVDNLEGEPAAMCLPLDKALDPDTLVATSMNGEPLLRAHGHPARLLVPGWVGAYSVKWLARIEVSSTWVSSWRADEYYRLRSADGIDRGPATAHPIKSCLALDWPATLPAGVQSILGYARSGHGEVARVEVSIDHGPWFDAPIVHRQGRWGWMPFEFEWDAPRGDHSIRTRAWDGNGRTQPDTMQYCPNTILWNGVTSHPVEVS